MNAGELHRLARTLREIAVASTADAGEEPVSAGLLAIAEDISHQDGTSIGAIAQRTGLAQSLVSRTVAQLRDAGIVRTAPDPADGRRLIVGLDPSARRGLLRTRGARPIDDALRQVRPGLSEARSRRVQKLLDELAGLLA